MAAGRVSRVFRRRWVQVLVVLAAFVALVVAVAPMALSVALQAALMERGAQNVRIGDVELNLFTTQFSVDRLRVNPETGLPVDAGRISGSLSARSLLEGRVLFEHLALRDVDVVVSRTEGGEGWKVGGIGLAPASDQEEGEPDPVVGVRDLVIENSTLRLQGEGGHLDVRVSSGRIQDFLPWQPDPTVSVSITGSIGGAALEVEGTARPGAAESAVEARVSVKGLRPDALAVLVPDDSLLPDGEVDASGTVTARLGDDGITSAAFDGKVTGRELDAAGRNAMVPEGRLNFSGELKARYAGPGAISAAFEGGIGGEGIRVAALGESFPLGRFAFSGKVHARVEDADLVSAGFDGTISGGGVQVARLGENFPEGRFEFSGKATARVENVALVSAGYDGTVSGAAIRVGELGENFPQGRFEFSGDVSAGYGGAAAITARYDGKISGTEVVLPPELATRRISAERFSWSGEASAKRGADEGISWSAAGKGAVDALIVPLKREMALTVGKAEIDGLVARDPMSIEVASLGLSDVAIRVPGSDVQAPLAADRIAARDLSLSTGPVLAIGSVTSNGAELAFLRTEEGIRGIQDAFGEDDGAAAGAAATGEAAPTEKAAEVEGGFALRIGSLDLAKGGIVRFRDSSVTPEVTVEWQLDEARITDVNSAEPDEPLRFDINGSTGQYGDISAQGRLRPFGESVTADVQATLQRVDLPPLSPYLAERAGYVFRSGEGNLKLDVKLGASGLDGRADINLRGMQVEPAAPDAAREAEQTLNMPLGSALSLLRDAQDDISLEIPIKGDPRAPEFDIGGVIAQATTSAIRRTGVAFLKYSLQPFGAALLVGDLAKKFAGAIRLEPATFPPGQKSLTPRLDSYMKNLAQTLRNRPKLRLTLCGRAVSADRAALAGARNVPLGNIADESLVELARERADAVKAALVGDLGIAPDRLISCGPAIDTDEGAEPRVEFVI